jgi:hypothetical protein
LQAQAVSVSPACIATLELGVLKPSTVMELFVHEAIVRPTTLEFNVFPACHGGAAVWSWTPEKGRLALVGTGKGVGTLPKPEPAIVTVVPGKFPFKVTFCTTGWVVSLKPVTHFPPAFDQYCGTELARNPPGVSVTPGGTKRLATNSTKPSLLAGSRSCLRFLRFPR